MDLFSASGGVSEAPPFVSVRLDGPPQGKGRARGRIVTPRSGRSFVSFYTPAATRAYEDSLKIMAKIAMRRKKIIEGPVAVRITATMPVPKSWSDKKRDAALTGSIHATTKPDFDNLAKNGTDALKGIVWKDDACVVRALVIKQYGERPSLVVEVYLM